MNIVIIVVVIMGFTFYDAGILDVNLFYAYLIQLL